MPVVLVGWPGGAVGGPVGSIVAGGSEGTTGTSGVGTGAVGAVVAVRDGVVVEVLVGALVATLSSPIPARCGKSTSGSP